MKLRNKKTGQEGNFIINKDHFECVDLDYVPEYRNLAELNEEWEDYEEPKEYWFIGYDAQVECIAENDSDGVELDKEIGNYFETEEEAELAVEKLKAWQRLKACGFNFYFLDRTSRAGDADLSMLATVKEYMGFTEDLDLLFGGNQ